MWLPDLHRPEIEIYDALWKLESDILEDLDLSLDYHTIGGMHISLDHKSVELEIRNKSGRFITDAQVTVSEWLS
jgi:hypothetical protein